MLKLLVNAEVLFNRNKSFSCVISWRKRRIIASNCQKNMWDLKYMKQN